MISGINRFMEETVNNSFLKKLLNDLKDIEKLVLYLSVIITIGLWGYAYLVIGDTPVDFLIFYNAGRLALNLDFSLIYSTEFWYNLTNETLFFVYLPFSLFFIVLYCLGTFNSGLWAWRITMLIFAIWNKFLLYKVLKTKFKFANKYLIPAILLLSSLMIVNYYDFYASQRNSIVLWLILNIILVHKNEEDSSKIKINWKILFLWNLLVAIQPTFGVLYAVYVIIYDRTYQKMLVHLSIFVLLNIPLLFVGKEFLQSILLLKSDYHIVWYEYSFLGVFWIYFGNENPISLYSIVFIVLSMGLYIIKHWKWAEKKEEVNIIDMFEFFAYAFILFNVNIEHHHYVAIYPIIMWSAFKNLEANVINRGLSEKHGWIFYCLILFGCVLITFPIPSAVFSFLKLDYFQHLKRIFAYIICILPLFFKLNLFHRKKHVDIDKGVNTFGDQDSGDNNSSGDEKHKSIN